MIPATSYSRLGASLMVLVTISNVTKISLFMSLTSLMILVTSQTVLLTSLFMLGTSLMLLLTVQMTLQCSK